MSAMLPQLFFPDLDEGSRLKPFRMQLIDPDTNLPYDLTGYTATCKVKADGATAARTAAGECTTDDEGWIEYDPAAVDVAAGTVLVQFTLIDDADEVVFRSPQIRMVIHAAL